MPDRSKTMFPVSCSPSILRETQTLLNKVTPYRVGREPNLVNCRFRLKRPTYSLPMPIRVQPKEIEIPENNPFKYDLLEREEPIKILTNLVGSLEGPCVMSIDSAWGNGKTTFLRLWERYLQDGNRLVVKFSAWETDFATDPLVALSKELLGELVKFGEHLSSEERNEREEFATGLKVLELSIVNAIRLATSGLLDITPIFDGKDGSLSDSQVEARFADYVETKDSLSKFRSELQKTAKVVSDKQSGFPVIVMIDELDRCRPSYAVRLLEVAKHLFSVDHIVFLLAVNTAELAHSVKAVYGVDFDANGYLSRFFDIGFRLPNPDRNALIDASINALQIREHIERTRGQSRGYEFDSSLHLINWFLGDESVSVRTVLQFVHHFGLILASLNDDQPRALLATTVLLVFRTLDRDLYYKFIRRQDSDLQVKETLLPGPRSEEAENDDSEAVFEAMIIVAEQELSPSSRPVGPEASTPLLEHYQQIIETSGGLDRKSIRASRRPSRVVGLVRAYRGEMGEGVVGFKAAVRRVELLASEFVNGSG